ncbi:MAG: hypothetical protein PF503_01715 [Desulfobacula sp.]|jgi:CRISPR-associated protein Cmr1|nr:hypothetical protein [Desulfobacula sp.]
MGVNVSRFMDRKKAGFSIEVLTPMFLGGAEGHAELRSPPFKNALRYWWRLTQGNLSAGDLLKAEQKLFGGVNDKASRSRVDVVVTGDISTWSQGKRVDIGSKKNPEAKGRDASLSAYLGMGPVHFTGKLEKTAILPGQAFRLSLTYPAMEGGAIEDALSLFAHLGCLGSRSRNGWGSIQMTPDNPTFELRSMGDLYVKYGADIRDIFKDSKKYPFRLGYRTVGDNHNKPMMWKICDAGTWEDAMKGAAENYMDLRQVLKFPGEKPQGVQTRHIVGYPVTGHPVREWGGFNGRMPSQLRIVVRRHGDGFQSCFVHLPHRIPKLWDERRLGTELSVWQELHSWMDKNCSPIAI